MAWGFFYMSVLENFESYLGQNFAITMQYNEELHDCLFSSNEG